MNEEEMERQEKWRSKMFDLFFIVVYFYSFFAFLVGGYYKSEEQIQRDREMTEIGVHDYEIPKLKKKASRKEKCLL